MLKSFLSMIIIVLFCLSLSAQNSGEQHWEQIPGLIDGSIDVIEIKENELIVGGPFYSIDFDSNAANIAKWNGSGWETFGTGVNGWCTSIAFIGDDMYAAGSFTKAGDEPSTAFIARWDGTKWNSVGGGLNLHVNTLAVKDSEIYAGGIFRNAGGNPDADRIAKWNGEEWLAMDKGIDGWVYSIAVHNGEIYAGGAFTSAAGDTNIKFIAKWNSTDSLWESFGNGLNNWVHHIAFHNDEMYIGGFFTDAGGNPNADHIAKWNGTSWEGLGTGLNGDFSEVEEFDWFGDDMYVVGQFNIAGDDSSTNNVAKWNGASWEKLGYGVDQEARSLVFFNSDLYIGGSFSSEGPGGLPDIHTFARWKGITTELQDEKKIVPDDFILFQNYPNPFNPTTKIKFIIPTPPSSFPLSKGKSEALSPLFQSGDQGGFVTLKIFDILGNEVATLVNEQKPPGTYEVTFNAVNLPSGVYFCRLQANGLSLIKKFTLLK